VGRSVCLRAASAADRAFLSDVYASTRADELALTGWDAATRQAFVEHQFNAQDAHYRRHYDAASFDVIVIDGAPAGRLYVNRGPRDIRIVDITLLPGFRGRGAGTTLIAGLLEEARSTGRSVSIHVELDNPARSLYGRLGFTAVEEHGVHLLMEWTPPADQAKMAS
jgi:ribosomal protein S18 acetylase RimI-like enzyme